MGETITIFAESIDDITPVSHESVEVTLTGVDIGNILSELDFADILNEIGVETVKEWLDEKAKDND